MRIAFVIGTLGLGGTESQVCRLASELAKDGHDVRVFVLTAEGPLGATLDAAGVPWEGFGYSGLSIRDDRRRLRPWKAIPALRTVFALWGAMRRFRPDVCHAFLLWAYIYGMIGAGVLRIRVRVSSRRGPWVTLNENRLDRPAGRFSNRFAHVIVANSEAGRAEAIEDEGVPADRVRVIRNGVDIPERAADVSIQPATALLISNLIAYKGHLDLIAALATLDEVPVVRLVGDGPERAALQAAVDAAGLSDKVLFEGRVLNARDLYQEVQFGLLVSHQEGMPNAVIEGMAAGVPMVATSVGGVTEVVQDGATGLLVPPRDPPALAAAIKRISADPALRSALGSAARRQAESWSWDRCKQQHLELYREFGARG
jgi:glycosyltransferase involved in cell wall biosynthesis